MRIDLEKGEKKEEDKNILDRSESSLTEILNSTKKKLKGEAAEYEYGALIRQRPAAGDAGITLGWGFTSGGNKLWFRRNEGRGLVACATVLLAGDNPPLVGALDDAFKSKSWKKGYDSSEYPSWYITCSAQSLRNDTHGFTKAFERWAEDKVKEAERLVRVAKAKVSKAKTEKR
jgi:hypothetical protein